MIHLSPVHLPVPAFVKVRAVYRLGDIKLVEPSIIKGREVEVVRFAECEKCRPHACEAWDVDEHNAAVEWLSQAAIMLCAVKDGHFL